MDDWMKDSFIEDLASAHFKFMGKIAMCRAEDVIFGAMDEMDEEYLKEMTKLEDVRDKNETERIRYETIRARRDFLEKLSCSVAMGEMLGGFCAEEISILLSLQSPATSGVPMWMIGTIFAEIHTAYAKGLVREIGSTVPEGEGWSKLCPMTGLQKAVFYVYEEYYQKIKELGLKDPVTNDIIRVGQILEPRCELAHKLLFELLKESALIIPGNQGFTIAGDDIYICSDKEKVLSRMK